MKIPLPAGGPRPAPGVEAALVGASVALVSVVAPSDCGGVIESSVVASVELLPDGVVAAPLVMSPGLAALVGESEPETTVGSEAVVAVEVAGAVAATGAAVETPLTVSAPAPVVEVATGTVVVCTDVTVCVTGTCTVVVVVVVSTVVVGTVVWVTAGCAGVEELIGALEVCVETVVGAGLEIGALVVGDVVLAGAVLGWVVVGVEVASSAWRA